VAIHAGFGARIGVPFDCGDVLLFVAIKAKLGNILGQQFGLGGSMRVMAGRAIFHHVVFEFRLVHEIVMAVPAKRGVLFHQQLLVGARMGIVAGDALAVFSGLMLGFFLV